MPYQGFLLTWHGIFECHSKEYKVVNLAWWALKSFGNLNSLPYTSKGRRMLRPQLQTAWVPHACVCIRDSLFVSFCSIVFSKSLTHQYQFFIWTRTDLKRKKWIQTALEILKTLDLKHSGNRNSNSGIVYSKIRRGDRKIMCVCTVTMVSNFSFPRPQTFYGENPIVELCILK